jgi:dihydrodipicolinate synthase/N-acetylneuraminate lyase
MERLRGTIPPMLALFKENGELDTHQQKILLDFLLDRVDGLFINGSYGSGPLMTLDERKQVAELSVARAAGRIKMVNHVGTTNTRDSLELARHAEQIGCDAIAAVGPYYYHHSPESLVHYYTSLVDAVRIPVYIYQNPKFSGYEIPISVILALKGRGIRGIKDATFDILLHAQYARKLRDDDFDLVLGTEALFAAAHVYGTLAFIPGLGNAFPEICHRLYVCAAENSDDLVKTQFLVDEAREIMYLAKSSQVAVFAMLELRGIVKAFPRAPFLPASDDQKAAIQIELRRIGLL